MVSVTLDTSVYIGALNSGGVSSRLFTLARERIIRIDVSDAILDETIRVLREKFGWDGYRLHDARLRLSRRCRYWKLSSKTHPTIESWNARSKPAHNGQGGFAGIVCSDDSRECHSEHVGQLIQG